MIKYALIINIFTFSDIDQKDENEYFCHECDVHLISSFKYVRHLYAHTFIKIDAQDMPCICTSCGKDFLDRDQFDLHLPMSTCSGTVVQNG